MKRMQRRSIPALSLREALYSWSHVLYPAHLDELCGPSGKGQDRARLGILVRFGEYITPPDCCIAARQLNGSSATANGRKLCLLKCHSRFSVGKMKGVEVAHPYYSRTLSTKPAIGRTSRILKISHLNPTP
jgi:hypothetical protein